MSSAEVVGIYVGARAKQLPSGVSSARFEAGRGVVGDRYWAGKGSFSHWRGSGRALTLVEAEALDDARLEWAAARRNVVTRGVGLNELVGAKFRIGEVECVGRRLCDPCRHLEKLTEDGMMRALADRGGLRADVLSDGVVSVGDPLVVLDRG